MKHIKLDPNQDRLEQIKELTYSQKLKICQDSLDISEPDLTKAILNDLKNSYSDKELIKELLELIPNGKAIEVNKYLEDMIYFHELNIEV